MKIIRLSLLLLAFTLTATISVSAKTHGPLGHHHARGGSRLQTKAAGWYWYCYATPEEVNTCNTGEYSCWEECTISCGGPCDWDK